MARPEPAVMGGRVAAEDNPVLERLRAVGWLLVLSVLGFLGMSLWWLLLASYFLSALVIGIPLLVLSISLLRLFADGYRTWAGQVMGVEVPRPYRSLPPLNQLFPRLRVILGDPATWRDLAWLTLNSSAVALLCAIPPLALLSSMFWFFQSPIIAVLLPEWMHETYYDLLVLGDIDLRWVGMLVIVPIEVAVFWLASKPVLKLYLKFTRFFLGPPETARLARRVDELAESRADAVDTQAAELRRVERDLHDGAQARLVSLGLTLGMAEEMLSSNPKMAQELLAEARQSSGQALSELRDLVRGIHPPVLADRGLEGAVRALALNNALQVDVSVDLPERAPAPVESAIYFAVAESLTNAAKHSGASNAWVHIHYARDRIRVEVGDSGCGGASSDSGGGLRGIQRRLAAFDGTMTLVSPRGGPTKVSMELPCALSSVKTTPSSGTA